ncbi:ATP-binding cassette subfamily C exporter for protease/lipase/ATP-binding cassette subfamily C protein EexD [Desulfobotulus alkaliphilus]|uniref:ATP-binding cassette subfamily C exporter for protease/lipase/ATP-binding cassette subfamily C protein EexD n=1 Tax=Desulfobotulus alkaliphilus TaxID=622671 RepID=A0A562RCB7_9BACT|nr:type I secretion system permease/ATPase [Desulfobotulus alkaliphilus]TWI66080.1 ATP-binding cassette subfamily C exporter for protease/lipase/ATP-binding cassette subfamily C protein EexD [Desulfobotulus alkaliphilus]
MNKKNPKAGQEQKGELASLLLTFKTTFFSLGIFSFIINMLMIVPAVYMLQIYDRVLMSANQTTLLMLTLVVLLMYVILAALEGVRSRVMVRAGNKMDAQINHRTFDTAFEKALRGASGRAGQTFSDMTNVRQFLTGNGLFAFFDAPWAPIYLFIIYMLHPMLGVFSTVAALILIFLAFVTEWASRAPLGESNKAYNSANTFANMNFRNAEVIQAMGMLDNVRRHWKPKHDAHISWQAIASERAGTIQAFTKFIRLSAQSLILGLGAYYVIHHEITAGMMIAGSILMGRALAPVELLIGTWKHFVGARGAYQRLEEHFALFPEREKSMKLPPPKGHITCAGLVSVAPGTSTQILKGLSFEVHPGDTVGIVGPSASGKSTLARLLVGAWFPAHGAIRLDAGEIHAWDKEQLGPHIGYLPQDIELLEGSVAQNIARFGKIDSDAVVDAAQIAGVHEMILQFPDGYETYIGEGGTVLSGGQRQRIGLARAIYGHPVLLVLDEPNSNLDDAGEEALVQALARMKKEKRTIFVITHKTSVLTMVDKLMMLSAGQIQAFGPRDDVLRWIQEQRQKEIQAK